MKDGLENIDEVFKQAFEGFEANVDPSVWTNIQSGLNAGATSGSPQVDPISSTVTSSVAKSAIIKIAATVVAVGTIATASYYVVTSGDNKEKTVAENTITELPVNEKETAEDIQTEAVQFQDENSEAQPKIDKVEENVVEDKTTPNKIEAIEESLEKDIPIMEDNNNPSNIQDLSEYINKDAQKPSSTINKENDNSSQTEDKKEIEKKKVEEPEQNKIENTTKIPSKPEKKLAVVDDIPNVITPNGDGINDVIKITGENLEKLELVIMDKNGKPVFRITNLDQEWNGKNQNGFDLLPGMYYMAGVVVDNEGNTKNIKQAINLLK